MPSALPSPVPSTSILDKTQDPELATLIVDDQPLSSTPFPAASEIKECDVSPVLSMSSASDSGVIL